MAIPPHATPLGRVLADQIRRDGRLSFGEFMRRCLYDPAHGYYAKAALKRDLAGRGTFSPA